MTDAARLGLRPGDRVVYRDDFGDLRPAVVRSEPWRLGSGAWVVSFVGRVGGYDLARVVRRDDPAVGDCR